MSDVPLTGGRIAALVTEVADELPARGHRRVIVVVGGSLLAWYGLRGTTVDVDTLARIDLELAASVERVAVRHGLAPKWLNDSAAGYRPQTLDEAACAVLLDHPRLQVLGARFRDVFLMKLLAARAADQADLEPCGRSRGLPLRSRPLPRCTPRSRRRPMIHTSRTTSPTSRGRATRESEKNRRS